MSTIYTIGHSNHTFEKFLELLKRHHVNAIADVRSHPFSRYVPQFNRDTLSAELKKHGIVYVFLGRELGARPNGPSFYDEDGRVCYDRIAESSDFKAGIERVLKGAQKYRIALMCAEKDPINCHRTLLVARALEQHGASIVHILGEDDKTETQKKTIERLLKPQLRLHEPQPVQSDMFDSDEKRVERACKTQERKIAYQKKALAGKK